MILGGRKSMSTMTDLKDPVDQDIGGKKVDVHND
jgi:hypothetical protein